MNTLLLRSLEIKKSPSVQTFAEYRLAESQNTRHSSVTKDGELLEHQTLELRVHPPNVTVDNSSYEDRTVITVDSANRPGTLVEVVQCLTELGLNVKKARISSDGGWFVDEFHVTEVNNSKVTTEQKLSVIRAVLNVEYEHDEASNDGSGLGLGGMASGRMEEARQMSTVFELAGEDRVGLLADVLSLFTDNGCDVRSAAVWTYRTRVAVVVAVVQNGRPVTDSAKLTRLTELLHTIMDQRGNSIVRAHYVKGLIHFERRLHQLMLREEEKEWQQVKEQVLAAAGIPHHHGHTGSSEQWQSALDTGAGGAGAAAAAAAGGGSLPQNGRTPLAPAAGYSNSGSSNGSSGSQRSYAAAPAGSDLQQLQQQKGGAAWSQQQQQQSSGVHMVSTTPAVSSSGGGSGAVAELGPHPMVSPKYSRPEVTIGHYSHLNYWMVTIKCKDRNKLFFDTVCTLSDLEYDVYHGAIDSESGIATQLYYIRPRYGDFFWDAIKATKLRVMLEAAIQRRFPKGMKIHVQQTSQHCLRDLTVAWKQAGLWITRAKVRAYHETGHTLYVMDSSGQPPDPKKVYEACQASGGRLQEQWDGSNGGTPVMTSSVLTPRDVAAAAAATAGASAAVVAGGGAAGGAGVGVGPGGSQARFFFSFLQRNWDGSPNSLQSA